MKVLLVLPTFKYTQEYPAYLSLSDFPCGLGYIAASLKQAGHEVYGLNPNNITGYANAFFMMQDLLKRRIAEVKPELIGLGGLCIDYPFLKDAIKVIRGVDPKIPIVLGGQIVTNDAEFIYQDLKPDYAIRGEGEWAMRRLADGMDGKKIIDSLPLNLDDMPFPDYEVFGLSELLDKYSGATRLLYRYSRPHPRPYVLVASRGCTFNCNFCIDHHRSYRSRSMANIVQELKEAYEKYHFNVLIINDELFAVKKDRLNEFSEVVEKGREDYHWDFDWMFQTHASARLDLESLQQAKKAGCYLFSYGLESASPVVLESMNKKTQVSQVIEAIGLAEEAGLSFSANLIFGDPAETEDSVAQSLAFWFTYGQKAMIFMSPVKPYPGSDIFNYCLDNGIIRDKKVFYEHIDENIINMTKIPEHRLQQIFEIIDVLERSWIFVKLAKNVRWSLDGDGKNYLGYFTYLFTCNCPYCDEVVQFSQAVKEIMSKALLGVACPKCGRRIKLET